VKHCDDKLILSKESAHKNFEAEELKARLQTLEGKNSQIEEQLNQHEQDQSSVNSNLLATLVDLHIPFTFKQGQVEIPSEVVLVDD
jgi:predicted nuclease with TOPRIM domain